jgi:antitoxin component of MazEF toxin-antitoxin module
MGYQVKIQRVERGATKSFYVNFPAAVAEASQIEKGEEMEWVIEDKNTFILQRVKKIPARQNKVDTQNKVEKKLFVACAFRHCRCGDGQFICSTFTRPAVFG